MNRDERKSTFPIWIAVQNRSFWRKAGSVIAGLKEKKNYKRKERKRGEN